MTDFGTTPLSDTTVGNNQFPVSAVFVPGTAGGNLTAMQGGPASTDGNGFKSAPGTVYVPDGNDVTVGAKADSAITDATTTNTHMSFLKGLVKILASAWDSVHGRLYVDGSGVTQPVSGSVSVSNFPGTQVVSGTVTANAGANLNTSALALESGGHLASIDSHTPALGQAIMANSVPVVLASNQSNVPINIAQVLGAILSATNPIISQAQFIAAVQAGKIFSASIGQKTYGAGVYAGMSIFNNSSAKNVLILSFRIFNSTSPQAAFLYLTATTDPAFGTALTPTNNLAGGAGSVLAANCSYALSGLSTPGTGLKYANQASTNTSATTGGELIPRDCPILLPANSPNGVAGYIAGSSGNSIFADCTWMEY